VAISYLDDVDVSALTERIRQAPTVADRPSVRLMPMLNIERYGEQLIFLDAVVFNSERI